MSRFFMFHYNNSFADATAKFISIAGHARILLEHDPAVGLNGLLPNMPTSLDGK